MDKLRTGGVLTGLENDRPDPNSAEGAVYVCTDTHRAWMVHRGEWSLMPITWYVETNTARDALNPDHLNEGDWCWVYSTSRYSFWNGSQWRQVRY